MMMTHANTAAVLERTTTAGSGDGEVLMLREFQPHQKPFPIVNGLLLKGDPAICGRD